MKPFTVATTRIDSRADVLELVRTINLLAGRKVVEVAKATEVLTPDEMTAIRTKYAGDEMMASVAFDVARGRWPDQSEAIRVGKQFAALFAVRKVGTQSLYRITPPDSV